MSAAENPLFSEGFGAGEGNRTLLSSLGSCRSAIELRPRVLLLPTTALSLIDLRLDDLRGGAVKGSQPIFRLPIDTRLGYNAALNTHGL
jgi:hypothetical protein